jgi:hypothetical protein
MSPGLQQLRGALSIFWCVCGGGGGGVFSFSLMLPLGFTLQDFFRRHSGAVNIKERCEAPSRDPATCLGGKTSRHCQLHRYQRCLEVGMQPLAVRGAFRCPC